MTSKSRFLTPRECEYFISLAEAYMYPGLTPAMKQVLRMRSIGMNFDQIDKRRGFIGSSQLYGYSKLRMQSLLRRIADKGVLDGSDIWSMLLKAKNPAHGEV